MVRVPLLLLIINHILLFSLIFIVFLILNLSNYGYCWANSIVVIPNSIDYTFSSNTIHVPPIGLTLISNYTLNNIKWSFSDLIPENNDHLWISKDHFNILPNKFNISKNNVISTYINMFNMSNFSGSYLGNLSLIYNNTIQNIPLKITIKGNEQSLQSFLQPFILTGGALLAFFIQFLKISMESKDIAIESLERCISAATISNLEKRFDASYKLGEQEYKAGIDLLRDGRYKLARKRFEKAENFFHASKISNSIENFEYSVQMLTVEMLSKSVDQESIKKLVSLGFKDSDMITFGISSIVLIVLVMQLWLQIYTQLPKSFTELYYINAFIVGYGSQSLIGQAIESLKSRK